MPTTSSAPITVSPEAAARVRELNMQRDLERMLEHVCQTLSGLREINVALTPACDPGDEPRVVLEVLREGCHPTGDSTWREWRDWMIDTFPSATLGHFSLLVAYGPADER